MTTVRAGTRGTVVDLRRVRLAVAGELRGAFRDQHLRAELLRLRVRAPASSWPEIPVGKPR